jgi:hypothetical protein
MPEQSVTFKQWMKQVDAELVSLCGLVSMDLADQCYHDWYDDGMTPEEAAVEAFENQD